MMARMVGTKIWMECSRSIFPDGDYPGIWNGYEVTFTLGADRYKFPVDNGIRTMSAKCVVHIKSGVVSVETLK